MEHIILIGHGSPRKDANTMDAVCRLLHKKIHPACSGRCVRASYLQFAEPELMDVVAECVEAGADSIIIHPFFLSSGMHVTKDIPEMIGEASRKYPSVRFVYTEPLGLHERLIDIILDRISEAGFRRPLDIEKRSFELITDEIDLSGVPGEQAPIIKRVVHATADFEFRDSLLFHPEAVKKGIALIKSGLDILTDVEMVRTGINRKMLEKWGGRVLCAIGQEETVGLTETGVSAHSEMRTRAEAGIESAMRGNDNIGIIAIGNAPTALLRAVEIINDQKAGAVFREKGILVIGLPVGFVKAYESKSILSSQQFPYITNLSRKGGTPAAVAIVNALLKMAGEEEK